MNLPQPFPFSLQTMQRNPTLVLPSQHRLHKLRFVQKLDCQKPCLDLARISSLVNKQVGVIMGNPIFNFGFGLYWVVVVVVA